MDLLLIVGGLVVCVVGIIWISSVATKKDREDQVVATVSEEVSQTVVEEVPVVTVKAKSVAKKKRKAPAKKKSTKKVK